MKKFSDFARPKVHPMLEKFGVTSVESLSESEFSELCADIATSVDEASASDVVNEEEIKDEKSFRQYAEKMLKKAHGEDYDADKAKEMIDGILSKVDGDFDKAVGMLQSSMD